MTTPIEGEVATTATVDPDVTPAMRLAAYDVAYEGTPSWDTGRPQPCVTRMLAEGLIAGAVLDIGCGTGINAIEVARAGHAVVGIDGAQAAVAKAASRVAAADRAGAIDATFVVGDALRLDGLGRQFDTVLDIGLFHCLQPYDRATYAASLAPFVRPGGVLLLVAWSDRNPLGYGPERVTRRAIRSAFQREWKVESIEDDALEFTAAGRADPRVAGDDPTSGSRDAALTERRACRTSATSRTPDRSPSFGSGRGRTLPDAPGGARTRPERWRLPPDSSSGSTSARRTSRLPSCAPTGRSSMSPGDRRRSGRRAAGEPTIPRVNSSRPRRPSSPNVRAGRPRRRQEARLAFMASGSRAWPRPGR